MMRATGIRREGNRALGNRTRCRVGDRRLDRVRNHGDTVADPDPDLYAGETSIRNAAAGLRV